MTPRVIPMHPVDHPDDASRRTFVKLLGATLLAGSGIACAKPGGEIIPSVDPPPEIVPGVPLHVATSMELDGYGTGLLAESREGRPVKLEGNPAHPASLGAAGVHQQAAVLQRCDPDRARGVLRGAAPAGWLDVRGAFSHDAMVRQDGTTGAGLRLLLEPTASPVMLEAVARVRARYPGARVYLHAPPVPAAGPPGRGALTEPLQPIYDFSAADVVAAVDADPLAPAHSICGTRDRSPIAGASAARTDR